MKNKYEVDGEITKIFISRRNGDLYEFLIDTEDLQMLLDSGGSWCVDLPYNHKDPARKPYAIRNAVRKEGGREFLKLHRVLMYAPKGLVVDHINGDTLDNRKQNLRITNLYGNAQNIQEPSRNNKSGELNVYFNEYDKIWVASIMRNGVSTRAKRKDFQEAVVVAREMREGLYIPRKKGKPNVNN